MPVTNQHAPTPSSGDCWRLVIEDMEARRRLGIARYGTPLQPHNGRDALVDAYQEALDLAVYLRQAIAERNAATPSPTDASALDLARRLAPGLAWEAEDDYEARAPLADGWARLTRDSLGRGYLTVLPGASGWRWIDDYLVFHDRLDLARGCLIGRCRIYLAERRYAPLTVAIASRVRGVQALLTGLEAATVPAEIRR